MIVFSFVLFVRRFVQHKQFATRDKEYLLFLLFPIITFTLYIFYPFPLWEHYLLPLTISTIFFIVLSIQQLITKKFGVAITMIFLILVSVPIIGWVNNNYFIKRGVVQTTGSFQYQKMVAEWIYQDANNKPFGYLIYSTGTLTYNMDYLFWWLDNTKYSVNSTNTKQSITYLILDKTSSNDRQFWKTNVARTNGTLLKKKTFNDELTVEKLSIPADEPAPDPNYYQNLIFR